MEHMYLYLVIIFVAFALPVTTIVIRNKYLRYIERINLNINNGFKNQSVFRYICAQIYNIPASKIKLEPGVFIKYITHWKYYCAEDICEILGAIDSIPLSNNQRRFILKEYFDAMSQAFDVDKLAFIYEDAVHSQMNPKARVNKVPELLVLALITDEMSADFVHRVFTLMTKRLNTYQNSQKRFLLAVRINKFQEMYNPKKLIA